MYIHGELKKYGFEIKSLNHFGDAENCFVDYEFKNDKITAIFRRYFKGRVTLIYSEDDNEQDVEFTTEKIEDESYIIHLVRHFLKNHA